MQLKITEDGSHTLFSPVVNECYHSQHGAIQESDHIFIKTGWEKCNKAEIRILEIGYGTGLNAFLTLLCAEKDNKKVIYSGIEAYPVKDEVWHKLNYAETIAPEKACYFELLHSIPWNVKKAILPFFSLEKIQYDFTQISLNDKYDLIYFDAFSPEKQPEMWTQERFEMLYEHSNKNGALVTYCSKGIVRRAMQAAGFKVERLQGPPGKREILRAVRL